jgi:glycosyltransferase involved in cell wall biosynthesis
VAFEKNIDFLLRTFVRVLTRQPDALFVIAGEGPALAHLNRLARELGIQDAVRFIGYLDRSTELPDCYAAGDAFVFASRTETQGLVLLEAMAQGTPVVSTAELGTRSILTSDCGAFVVPEQEEAFAAAVMQALKLAPDAQRRRSCELTSIPGVAGDGTSACVVLREVKAISSEVRTGSGTVSGAPWEPSS